MLNDPVNASDPSGHVTCDGSGDECNAPTKIDNTSSPIHIDLPAPGGGGPKNDDDHPHDVGEPDKELETTGDEGCQKSITNFSHGGGRWIDSWDGCGTVDPVEWELLLENIGHDVHNFSTGWYDTPFFDVYHLSGIGCFNGGKDCFDRSEINYIGEGQALAALGLTKKQTFYVVAIWKHAIYNDPPSPGTFKFTEIGWEYYSEHYSTHSHSLDPLIQMGTPIITPLLSP